MRAAPHQTTRRPCQRTRQRSTPAPRSPLTLADNALLDRSSAWLCHRRRHYPADADVWAFRRRWPEIPPRKDSQVWTDDFYNLIPVFRCSSSEDR
jgi:hypothetical protein